MQCTSCGSRNGSVVFARHAARNMILANPEPLLGTWTYDTWCNETCEEASGCHVVLRPACALVAQALSVGRMVFMAIE